MKILLSEHRRQTISIADEPITGNHLEFTADLFEKLNPENINIFKTDRGQHHYPFQLQLKENTCDLTANYYVGIDWLIKGEKFVQVEPKINSALITAFVAHTESDDIADPRTQQVEKAAEKAAETAESTVEVDYLSILLDLSGSPRTAPLISSILKIDWDAEQIPIEQKEDRLTPFLIVQFLQILKSIVRKGLKKSYYKVQNNLTNRVKGKILVGHHIKQNIFKNRITKTYCEYQEFGVNDLENRFLKKAFAFAVNYVQNDEIFFVQKNTDKSVFFKEELLHIINYCRPAFENVSNEIKEEELKNVKFNPFFKEYKEGIKLGGYILKKFSYNISNTTETKIFTPPFWIDMPILFELYFYRQLLQSNPKYATEIKYQFSTYGNSLDILITQPGFQMVIDTKYKLQHKSQDVHADIRQVSGYTRLNKVRKELGIDKDDERHIDCLIVYPDLNAQKNQDFNLEYIIEKRSELLAYHKVYKLGISLPIIL
ncbi:hypothetical protein OA84_09170 [Kaistella solincola]|uniref:Restriction endonuclease n=1 Tax=Kaistella solincola TaxID=510955 RepID=A0ABR4ZR80_9FLAO|nr:hypothetical protein [Kaistella solincola]KIA83646.1 hypothetical protein OA84_09170 [Kaistella solincola]